MLLRLFRYIFLSVDEGSKDMLSIMFPAKQSNREGDKGMPLSPLNNGWCTALGTPLS